MKDVYKKSSLPLKACVVHESDAPEEGRVLAFAKTRNQARHIGVYLGEYLYMTAVRMPKYDQYAEGTKPYIIDPNDDLPDGVEFFIEVKHYV